MSLLMDALRKAEESKKQAEQGEKEKKGASIPEPTAAPDQEEPVSSPVPAPAGATGTIPDTPIEFDDTDETGAADSASGSSAPSVAATSAGDGDRPDKAEQPVEPGTSDQEPPSGNSSLELEREDQQKEDTLSVQSEQAQPPAELTLSLEPMDESGQSGARQPLDVSAGPDYSAEPQLQSLSQAAPEARPKPDKPRARQKSAMPLAAGSKQQQLEEAMLKASSKFAGGSRNTSQSDNNALASPTRAPAQPETAVEPAANTPPGPDVEKLSGKQPEPVPVSPGRSGAKEGEKEEEKATAPSASQQTAAPAKAKSKAAKPSVELEKPGLSISARSEPDRRAARSVFAAKRKGKRFRIRRSTKIWALQIVAVLALVAGGYVIFFATAPSNDFNVPAEFLANSGRFSDEFGGDDIAFDATEDTVGFGDAGIEPMEELVADGSAAEVSTAVTGEPLATATEVTPAALTLQPEPTQTSTIAVLDETIITAQQDIQVDASTIEPLVSAEVETVSSEAVVAALAESTVTTTDQEVVENAASESVTEEVLTGEAASEELPATAETASTSAGISFVRRQAVSMVDPTLRQAYEAYQRGDLSTARSLYQEVLLESPQQRDALLGLAAIATADQDAMLAMQLYSRLLARDPSDSVARAGLLGLRPTGSIADQEREYRRMLEQQGEVAAVVYAVGNFYASQGRWNDAQRYYFSALQQAKSDALAGIPVNPDYAFNLAVSLERINQPEAAGTYYEEAISFASGHAASFDLSIARSRLASLAEVGSE